MLWRFLLRFLRFRLSRLRGGAIRTFRISNVVASVKDRIYHSSRVYVSTEFAPQKSMNVVNH